MTRQDKAGLNKRGLTADSNPDPITGQPGAHPVGTGVGAAARALRRGQREA